MNKNMKHKGFTLIELLVVVVVIGVLAGMSFVMIHGVIDAARMARSKSFSKSIQLQLALNEVGVWRFDDDPVIPAVRGVHDASGWGNHGTLDLGTLGNRDPAAAWVTGVFGRALRFDGADDFVEVRDSASLNITGAITIEAWVKATGPHRDGFGGIWLDNAAPHFNRFLLLDNGSLLAQFQIGGTVTNVFTDVGVAPLNEWAHVIYTYDGSNERIFVNGKQEAISPKTGTIAPSTTSRWIGRGHPTTYEFHGRIDEPRIYNRALKVFEVQQRYVKGLKSLLARGIISDEEFNARIAEKEKNLVVK